MAGILVDIENSGILEIKAEKFGNGAHCLISKENSKKRIKIITGKIIQEKNKIKLDLFGNNILEKTPAKFGTGYHITVPKEYSGKKIKLILEDK